MGPDQLASENHADLDLNCFRVGYIWIKHSKDQELHFFVLF